MIGQLKQTPAENCLKIFKICQKRNTDEAKATVVRFSLVSISDITLLHEIFTTHLILQFEVGIHVFQDTYILRFCENFVF